jgi:ferrochelatase
MRNWHPFLHDTLTQMKDKGQRRTLGIVLSAFQTEASWERYIRDVAAARARVGPGAPEVEYPPAWSGHPLFIEAMAARVEDALARGDQKNRSSIPLIFTAHSIPQAMAAASPYVEQFTVAARAVAERLAHPRWSIAYQSRSGSPRDAWIEPDICDALRALEGQGLSEVVVSPIGFICEHVEILYDLDQEARKVAEGLGLRLHRATPANDHPFFIAMLADLVRENLAK